MIQLAQSTNNARTNRLIAAIISIYEAAFPERLRGYYLVGSYGDDTPIAGSDIDMTIIVKGTITLDEQLRFSQIKTACRDLAPIHLDLPVIAEADFADTDTVAVKIASKFVYGEDTREKIPIPPMDTYLQKISTPTQRGLTVRFRSDTVTLPLDYPIPDDPYYGYIPKQYMKDDTPIKLWVLNVGWLATFLVVREAGVYIPSKRDMLPLYKEHIYDEWTEFLETVYEKGRNAWGYQIPSDEAELVQLKALMQQTLAFENHVAEQYVAYLREQLANSQPHHAIIALQKLSALRSN